MLKWLTCSLEVPAGPGRVVLQRSSQVGRRTSDLNTHSRQATVPGQATVTNPVQPNDPFCAGSFTASPASS